MTARAANPYLLGWPLWASVGAHAVAVVATSTVMAFTPVAHPAPDPVPIEVVRLDPPALVTAKVETKASAPRLVSQPAAPAPALPAALLPEAPRESASSVSEPTDSGRRFFAGATSPSWPMPGVPTGEARGAGKLLSTGDLPIAGPPVGVGGGSGEGPAAHPVRTASTGNPSGLTSFARPVGGYQTRPKYPDSARRQGVEGETLLRFQVLTSGRVASVAVARSAGHADLDRAAIDAVKTWLFEPARRGREAVAVWVTLPVRFRLRDGLGD